MTTHHTEIACLGTHRAVASARASGRYESLVSRVSVWAGRMVTRLTSVAVGGATHIAGRVAMLALVAGFAAGCPSKESGGSETSAGGIGSGASAGGAAQSEATEGKRPFRFINRGDIITLDLNDMSYLQDFRVTYAIREGLYTLDPETFKAVPALAIETSVSEDKKTWTFRLRPEAKWSNGDPVRAGDFVFSWRYMLEAPGEYTYLFYYIKNAEAYENSYRAQDGAVKAEDVGVRAPDDLTLVVELTNPVPFLSDLLSFPPFYPRHAASMEPFKNVDDKGRVSYKPEYTRPPAVVCNGPFVLTSWEAGRRLVMERNEQYWDRANVKSPGLEMVVNNDPQGAFIQYEQKQVDWLADVGPDIAVRLFQQKRPDLHVAGAFGTAFMTINCAESTAVLPGIKNPLSDLRVRRALSMAFDRSKIVQGITRMGEQVAERYIPPGFFPDIKSEPIPGFDVEAAKKELAAAGFPNGEGFPRGVTILYNADNPTRTQLAQFLKAQWRTNLGIDVEVKGIELKSYRNEVTSKNYTIALVAWYGDYMDPSTFTDKYLSTSQNNDSNWGPAAYDDLIARAASEPDEAKRNALLSQAETMINTELPIIPMYHYVNYGLWHANVRGLKMNAKQLTVFKPVYVAE